MKKEKHITIERFSKELTNKSGQGYVWVNSTLGEKFYCDIPQFFSSFVKGAKLHTVVDEKDGFTKLVDIISDTEKPSDLSRFKITPQPDDQALLAYLKGMEERLTKEIKSIYDAVMPPIE